MKQITKLSIIALFTMIILNSCTVQKRVYNRGLHIEWFDHKNSSDKAGVYSDVHAKKAEKHQIASAEQPLIRNYVTEENLSSGQTESIITESKTTTIEAFKDNSAHKTSPPVSISLKKKIKSGIQTQKSTSQIQKISKSETWKAMKSNKSSDGDLILLYILCFLLPPVAVGLATDWDVTTVIINILWCLLCGLPGVIHALIVVSREA